MNEEKEIEKTITEHNAWQEHQYDPGHWLGGNIPPYLLRPNKKLGIVLLVVGLIQLIFLVISFPTSDISQISILPFIAVLMILAGYFKLKGN